MKNIVIGKRVTLGVVINSIAVALVDYYPDHATAIMAASTFLIFIAQIIIVNRFGITQPES